MPSSTDDLRSLLRNSPGSESRNNTSANKSPARVDRDMPASTRRRSDRHERRPSVRPGSFDRPGSGVSVSEVVDKTASRERSRRVSDEPDEPDEPAKGPRSTSTLQQAWIDPQETQFEPVPRPGNPLAARLISWLVVAALLGGLGWLIIPELNFRMVNINTANLPNGVLTAQPVTLAPLRPAIVSELFVDASSLPDGVLPEGTPIALLEGTQEDGTGVEVREISVPFDARFVSVDTLVGGVVMPGTPVATVYDPSKMYVIVSVRPDTLELLRRGMTATLYSEVLDQSISGEVISAVPLLGTDHEPTTADLVNVRIKPDADAMIDFVPGIRFDAAIDLSSAPEDAQPLVITNAGHVDVTGAPMTPTGTEDGTENG